MQDSGHVLGLPCTSTLYEYKDKASHRARARNIGLEMCRSAPGPGDQQLIGCF